MKVFKGSENLLIRNALKPENYLKNEKSIVWGFASWNIYMKKVPEAFRSSNCGVFYEWGHFHPNCVRICCQIKKRGCDGHICDVWQGSHLWELHNGITRGRQLLLDMRPSDTFRETDFWLLCQNFDNNKNVGQTQNPVWPGPPPYVQKLVNDCVDDAGKYNWCVERIELWRCPEILR